MTMLRLALAYAWRRPLSTLLVMVLLALGVGVVTLTLLVGRELEARLARDAAGIDLVVGAKGSPLQIVLAGVYHVDVPPGNVPLAAVARLREDARIAEIIPLSLGDSFRSYRIVGTEPALLAHYGAAFASGGVWTAPMQAVIGADVARTSGLRVGASFTGSHGLAEAGAEHAAPYVVSGVLAPTGTVADRLVLTALESVWEVHQHHGASSAARPSPTPPQGSDKPAANASPATEPDAHDEHDEGAREVTLALVRYATPLAAVALPREINQRTELVAASPAYETARLLTIFGVGIDLIRVFAGLLVAASALMLLVALVQALEERRYDLAILRTLGAARWQVASVLLIESLLLTLVGTVCGLALAHALASSLGAWLPAAATLADAAARWHPEEGWIVAGALALGILAATVPAWRAARLDVAATLADT